MRIVLFCNSEVETVKHLFCTCTWIKSLWENVEYFYKIGIEDPKAIIFNEIEDNPKLISNFIVLVTKHFIYKQRCNGKPINFELLKNEINNYREIKFEITQQCNKVSQHNIK